jgi:hypothetical protein
MNQILHIHFKFVNWQHEVKFEQREGRSLTALINKIIIRIANLTS